jgi:hypothetical protein
LDYAAVVIPVTFANKDIDVVSPNFKALTDEDGLNMNECMIPSHAGKPRPDVQQTIPKYTTALQPPCNLSGGDWTKKGCFH